MRHIRKKWWGKRNRAFKCHRMKASAICVGMIATFGTIAIMLMSAASPSIKSSAGGGPGDLPYFYIEKYSTRPDITNDNPYFKWNATYEVPTEPVGTDNPGGYTWPINLEEMPSKDAQGNDYGHVLYEEFLPGWDETYAVRETKAPQGFVLDKTEYKVIAKRGTNSGINDSLDPNKKPLTLQVKEEPRSDIFFARIAITKRDKADASPIGGAVFDVRATRDITNAEGVTVPSGKIVQTVTTGQDGTAKTMPLVLDTNGEGDYELIEKSVPSPYVMDNTPHTVHITGGTSERIIDVPATVENSKNVESNGNLNESHGSNENVPGASNVPIIGNIENTSTQVPPENATNQENVEVAVPTESEDRGASENETVAEGSLVQTGDQLPGKASALLAMAIIAMLLLWQISRHGK